MRLIFLLAILGGAVCSQDATLKKICSACQSFSDQGAMAIRLGFTSISQAIPYVQEKCQKELGLSICPKIAATLVPYIFDMVTNSTFTGRELCSILLPPCSKYFPLPVKSWDVKLPAQTIYKKPPSIGRPPIRVLQLTDLHIDDEYSPGSAVFCAPKGFSDLVNSLLICCRGAPAPKGEKAAGYWGTTAGQCDIPYRTVESALKFIRDQKMKFDYILLTGDIVPHDMWNYTMERTSRLLRNVTASIENYLPNIPIYLTVGNHEAVPFDAFSYQATDQPRPQYWLYKILEQVMAKWTQQKDRRQLLEHGSYISYPVSGLKIINFNNNFCYVYNYFAYMKPVDPAGILSWLIRELDAAEKLGQKVHLHAHVPPTSMDCFPEWNRNYQQILERFRETIVEQFFGHNHVERNLVWSDSKGQPMVTGWVAPSLTTWSHVNPAFRTYILDGNKFNVISSSVYQAQIDDLLPSQQPKWYETNTALLYGLSSFSASSWSSYFERLKTQPTARFVYASALFRNSTWFHESNCNDSCAKELVFENFA